MSYDRLLPSKDRGNRNVATNPWTWIISAGDALSVRASIGVSTSLMKGPRSRTYGTSNPTKRSSRHESTGGSFTGVTVTMIEYSANAPCVSCARNVTFSTPFQSRFGRTSTCQNVPFFQIVTVMSRYPYEKNSASPSSSAKYADRELGNTRARYSSSRRTRSGKGIRTCGGVFVVTLTMSTVWAAYSPSETDNRR